MTRRLHHYNSSQILCTLVKVGESVSVRRTAAAVVLTSRRQRCYHHVAFSLNFKVSPTQRGLQQDETRLSLVIQTCYWYHDLRQIQVPHTRCTPHLEQLLQP